MKVKDVKISDIIVEDRFRQDMGDILSLSDNIKEVGLLQPITINQDMRLLAGGRRLSACEAAGLKKIPCIVRNTEGEQDELEIELIENMMRKDLEWHEQLDLEKRIHELKKEADPNWTYEDTASALGVSDSTVHRDVQLAEALEILPELKGEKSKSDALKKLKRFTREAQISLDVKEGRYTKAAQFASRDYMIGNAFECIEKVHDGVINFCEVDPPYAIKLTDIKRADKDTHNVNKYTEIDEEDYPVLMALLAREVHRIMDHNSFCIWWFGITHYTMIRDSLRQSGFTLSDVPAIWYKGSIGQTLQPDHALANSYETFFVCRKGRPQLLKPARSNVFEFAPVPPQRKIHATEKPIELMTEITDTFVWPTALCCIPFLGSGVTLRALYRHKTKGYGWDLEEENKNNFLAAVNEDIELGLIDV